MDNFRNELVPESPFPEMEPKGSTWKRTLLDILETILLSVILFLGINYVSARIRVESISMQPTLYAGNFVLVNRVAYRFGPPQRGDIIVFRYPPNPNETPYIKRVIGLPGDHVVVSNGQVIINGQVLYEPYLKVKTLGKGEWTVPADSLFVMGDNRNNSSDSRAWGMVPYANIIGKAEVLYWPPERWNFLNFPSAAAAAQP